MTLESSNLPRSQRGRPDDHQPRDRVNKNRLVFWIALLLMMGLAAAFQYRLQISPTGGLIFERIMPTEQPKLDKNTPAKAEP